MNSCYSGLARLASTANHPVGSGEELNRQDLEALIDCFSEIDTESKLPESNKIAYLEQLLRLREPRHLSETQQSGRRFVLDMLRLLSQLADGVEQHASLEQLDARSAEAVLPLVWDPSLEFKYLVYLMERTARPDLAARVRASQGITTWDEEGILHLREWLNAHGLDAHELALIQPNFFRSHVQKATEKPKGMRIHPSFVALSKATQERNHDYLAGTFFGLSQPIAVEASSKMKTGPSGLQEAMASIFDTPYNPQAATQTRLKAFLIPNQFGEPVLALSFMYE
jgi:hypothetical protein